MTAAVDAAGNVSGIATTTAKTAACADTTPPTTPGTLGATAVARERGRPQLGRVDRQRRRHRLRDLPLPGRGVHDVHAADADGGGRPPIRTRTVSPSTSYSYEVRALDAAGNRSPFSNAASAITPASTDTTPPSAPGTLSSTVISPTEIDLELGRRDRQRRRHRLPDRPLPGSRLHRLLAPRADTGAGHELQGHDGDSSDDVQLPGARARRRRQSRARTRTSRPRHRQSPPAPRLVAAYSFDAGSGATVVDASGNGNTGTIVNATWSTRREVRRRALVQRERPRRHPELAVAPADDRHDARGLGRPVRRPEQLAGRHLQGQRQLLPRGGVRQRRAAGRRRDVRRRERERLRHGRDRRPERGRYLALTYDGATLRLYVNGALVSTTVATGTIATSSNPLQIGGDSLYGQYFNGLIDEVRVYDGALTVRRDQRGHGDVRRRDQRADGADESHRNGRQRARRSTSPGARPSASAGIANYRVERCQGAGCSSFAQIATSDDTELQRHRACRSRRRTHIASGRSTRRGRSGHTRTSRRRSPGSW